MDPNLEKFFIISIGAVLGANARYWLGIWAVEKWGGAFPYSTFLINVTGSLLLGLFFTLAAERFPMDPRWRLLIAVGFLGSYTTFSTYTYESFRLFLQGQWLPGTVHLFGSTISGLLAVIIGVLVGKAL